MLRTDGYYLYQLGSKVHPLAEIKSGSVGDSTTYVDCFFAIVSAEQALDDFLNKSIFRLKRVKSVGEQLLGSLRDVKTSGLRQDLAMGRAIDVMEAFQLKEHLNEFEIILKSEFSTIELYLVSKKSGFDTNDLILNGYVCFPEELIVKVPECLADIMQATRCLAFELPTAAGFHFHRANEAVLHRYFNIVAPNIILPERSNMGDYLNKLSENYNGNKKVRAALRDLKNLHRNPPIHPDHSLESLDDAVDLMCAVRTTISHMLKAIPMPSEAAIADLFAGPPAKEVDAKAP